VNFFVCLFFLTGFALAADKTKSGTQQQDNNRQEYRVLFINSYGYDFETVPAIVNQVDLAFKQTASVQYLFMNEKYVDDNLAEEKLTKELEILTKGYQYDVVVVGDDAAFDYAIANRKRFFSGIPLIYANINDIAKAEKYQNDPLITGVVEEFPVRETIKLAQTIQKNAKKVVIITDDSVSGLGSAKQILDQQSNFPELKFEIFNCRKMSKEEIKSKIAQFSDETILMYTVFNTDKNGKRYTLAQSVKTITDAAKIPVFKADEAGMGYGLFGGYQLSYASVGKETVTLIKKALNKEIPLGTYKKGKAIYQFDYKVAKKFGIDKSMLPKNAIYINNEPTFYEKYKKSIWAIGFVLLVFLGAFFESQLRFKRKIKENNIRLDAEKQANIAKTEFLSRMSHDIRTPLNGIIGMTYLAQKENNSLATADALNKIDKSSKFLLSLINDILDMTKVESNKVELHPEAVTFENFQNAIESIIIPMCKEKNITFKTDFYPAKGYTAIFDNLRIKQVYYNLLSNAVKYNKPGGSVYLMIKDTLSPDKKFITCDGKITDTGIGMSKEFLKVLFEPFTQETQHNNLQQDGTGLGLSIVKKMVELMDGTISVESELGKGTTFYLRFVIPCVPTTVVRQQEAVKLKKELDIGILQGKQILICEDHPINQEIVIRILERVGMVVTKANNGKEAVEVFKQSAPDFFRIILMDIRMPIMDGLAATKEIRALDRQDAKKIPIIAMSANAFDEDVKTSLAVGMNAHLSKPINPNLLYQTIAKYI
jgi:signal transduction histidine kinase/CheY-like chemotaxis protein/ABC-type uncharacterized transport system substrate-binding protein